MALKKNLALMGTTTAVRLGAGLITFSVVARLLGPESFGVLMLWLSVSALITIVNHYGLNTYVLRQIGADPASAESIINEGLTGMLLLSVLVLCGATVAAWGLGIEPKQVFLCLLIAAVADTFSEFLNAGFRARDRFDVETRLATLTSFSHAVILVGSVLIYPTVEVAAAAYAVSRLLILAITVPAVARHFAMPRLVGLGLSISRLRKAGSYAVDCGFQRLFGQIDSVVLNYFVGPVAVGLHQAGMRMFMAGTQASTVLSNVFLPRASANHASGVRIPDENQKIQIVFISIGVFFGLMMAAFSRPIVSLLFGANYLPLVDLMPLFGLLFFLRFSAAAWGIVLTASGEQSYRALIGILFWVVVMVLAVWLVPMNGNRGWLMSLCLGSFFMVVGYGVRGRLYLKRPLGTAGLSVLGGVLFLPFILVH
ncbi:MAG: hypothetical protein B7X93_11455 [Hydrogenophilales bacterium 17-61-9]|nr:MAG: hypothetical protein B7X93_11455 [Hydrogenophilales bacterium 17-61-9]